MKYIFSAVLVVLTIILLVCVFVIRKNKNELKGAIRLLLLAGAVTQLSFAAAVFFTKETTVSLSYSIYFASIDWLLFSLLQYSQKYTNVFSQIPSLHITAIAISTIDTISMLVNIVSHHVYDWKKITYMNEEYVVPGKTTPVFMTHLIFTYIMVAIVIFSFVYKIIKVPAFYKKKYIPVIVCFLIIILTNVGYLMMKSPLDISLIMYAIMAIVVCRTSLYTIPDGIINDTFSVVITDYNDGIMCMDINDNCIYINSIMSQYLWVKEDDMEEVRARYMEWKEKEPHSADDYYTWEQKEIIDGEERYYEHNYRKLYDKKGNYIGCYFALKDKSVTLEQLRKERYHSTHDDLTGVYVAERFFEVAAERLAMNMREDWLIICSNIRDFKLFNYLYGRQVGNEILCFEANLLMEYASPTTVYGRLGEDRFALCMKKKNFTEERFQKFMEKIINAYQDKIYHMELQLGIYEVRDHTEAVSFMCDKAFLAIQTTKNQCNKNIIYYEPSMMEQALGEKRIVGEFETALAKKQFELYLQPQVTKNGDMAGARVHVRWLHPQKGKITDKEFVPVLERRGLVYKLNLYMMEQAAALLHKWMEQGKTEQVLIVKVFASDFEYFNVADEIIRRMKKYELNAKNMRLDMSEVLWSDAFERYERDMQKLQEFGFELEGLSEVGDIKRKLSDFSDYEQELPVKEYEEKYVQ